MKRPSFFRGLFPRVLQYKNYVFAKPNKSYSQFGEDIILQKLLKKKSGLYVDVGAYHPKHYSNTHLLYIKGWRGINIDPNPDTITLFNLLRGRDTNLQMGIAEREGHLSYYTFSHSNWNTFSKEKADEWMRKPNVRFLGEERIPCLPLRSVLEKHVSRGREIDLMNIDAEGMDLEVLESNDWEKYAPRVVVVEATGFNADSPETNKIYSFLKNKSYSLYAFVGVSLIFIKD